MVGFNPGDFEARGGVVHLRLRSGVSLTPTGSARRAKSKLGQHTFCKFGVNDSAICR